MPGFGAAAPPLTGPAPHHSAVLALHHPATTKYSTAREAEVEKVYREIGCTEVALKQIVAHQTHQTCMWDIQMLRLGVLRGRRDDGQTLILAVECVVLTLLLLKPKTKTETERNSSCAP